MGKLKQKYECDICGNIGEWDDNWRRYSSIMMEETCPDQIPVICSDECRSVFEEKLETGEIKMPKFGRKHRAVHSHVVRNKVGY